MPKEVRRRIFYCLILVFLGLGTSVVLYAQGWRIGFEPLAIGKVGGIYVRTFPSDAKIALDGEARERNIGIFDKGNLLNDILPGEYEMEISAPGFRSLTVPLVVNSSVVTRLNNVVLVPEEPETSTSTAIQDIYLVGRNLLMRSAFGTHTLAGLPIPGEALAASSDGAVIVSYSASTKNYYATDIARATSTSLGRSADKAAASFQPVPGDNTLFLATGSSGMRLLRTPGGDSLLISTTTAIASAAGSGRVVWATFDSKTNSSPLHSYDIPNRSWDMNFELVPGRITKLALQDSGSILALAKDGSLYLLDQLDRVRVAQGVRDMFLSEDRSRLAILDNQGLKIFLVREKGANQDIPLPGADGIQRLIWYRDSEHIFVQYRDKIVFLGLNDAGPRNFQDIAKTPRAEYEADANILYFLDGDILKKLSFPSS